MANCGDEGLHRDSHDKTSAVSKDNDARQQTQPTFPLLRHRSASSVDSRGMLAHQAGGSRGPVTIWRTGHSRLGGALDLALPV